MQNVKQNVTRCVPRSARASGHLSTRNSATRKPATLHTCAYVFFAWVCKLPSPQACEREISATGHIAFYGFANAAAPPFVHERAARKRWCTHPTPAKNPLLTCNPNVQSPCADLLRIENLHVRLRAKPVSLSQLHKCEFPTSPQFDTVLGPCVPHGPHLVLYLAPDRFYETYPFRVMMRNLGLEWKAWTDTNGIVSAQLFQAYKGWIASPFHLDRTMDGIEEDLAADFFSTQLGWHVVTHVD